jgi:hypothetical protein
MTARQRAIEIVETLAFKDARIPEILEILSEVGLGNSLSEWEIDAIVVKVDAARSALPPEPSKSLARWVGMSAAVLGMAAWAIGLRVAGFAVILDRLPKVIAGKAVEERRRSARFQGAPITNPAPQAAYR